MIKTHNTDNAIRSPFENKKDFLNLSVIVHKIGFKKVQNSN